MRRCRESRSGDGATGRTFGRTGRPNVAGRGRTCGDRPPRRGSIDADCRTVGRRRPGGGPRPGRARRPRPDVTGRSLDGRAARASGRAPVVPCGCVAAPRPQVPGPVREVVEARDRRPVRPTPGDRGSWSHAPIARVQPRAGGTPEPAPPPPAPPPVQAQPQAPVRPPYPGPQDVPAAAAQALPAARPLPAAPAGHLPRAAARAVRASRRRSARASGCRTSGATSAPTST